MLLSGLAPSIHQIWPRARNLWRGLVCKTTFPRIFDFPNRVGLGHVCMARGQIPAVRLGERGYRVKERALRIYIESLPEV